MIKKNTLIILFLAVLCSFSFLKAQSIEDIKSNKCYLWGEGVNSNPTVADDDALQHLISQISIKVESQFYNVVEENGKNIEEYTKKAVTTYSNVMLDEAQYLQEEDGEDFRVLRYISKSDYKKIFEKRERMIRDLVADGIRAENNLELGDALQSYYWALCLLRTHPDMDEIRGKGEIKGLLMMAIPRRIEHILSSLDINVASTSYDAENKCRKTILEFTSRGKKVSNLDFKYYSGNSWTRKLSNVNNGISMIDYFGAPAKDISDVKIQIEYIYENKPKFDISLNSAIELAYKDIPFFRKSQKKIDHTLRASIPKKEKITKEAVGIMMTLDDEKGQDEKCFETVLKFRDAFENKNREDVLACFTPEGITAFTKLMQYGQAERVPCTNTDLQCCKINDKYLVRSVPYKFSFPRNRREFIEKVVFVLNKDAKISAINFALSDIAINDIMKESEVWGSVERKQQIIHFMESYKTAYCLENIDFIEKIFSDEALIIVGQNLQSDKNIDSMYTSRLNNKDVKYIRMNKEDYLERLSRIFSNSEAINIHFEDTEVKRMQRAEDFTYGIQIAQNYYSSSYADKGYLFLLFDINDQNEPKIYVRSWQPEKSPEGSIIGIQDFVF